MSVGKYQTRRVVIEAEQWNGSIDHPHISWLHQQALVYDCLHNSYVSIMPGDWIITGTEGERYPCKPEVFAKKYEPAPPGEEGA